MSPTRRRQAPNWKRWSRAYMERFPQCDVRWPGCTGKTQTIHHRLTVKRSPSSRLPIGWPPWDRFQFVPICAACHTGPGGVHRNPTLATEEGWLFSITAAATRFPELFEAGIFVGRKE